jgi:hypothetical protein
LKRLRCQEGGGEGEGQERKMPRQMESMMNVRKSDRNCKLCKLVRLKRGSIFRFDKYRSKQNIRIWFM